MIHRSVWLKDLFYDASHKRAFDNWASLSLQAFNIPFYQIHFTEPSVGYYNTFQEHTQYYTFKPNAPE